MAQTKFSDYQAPLGHGRRRSTPAPRKDHACGTAHRPDERSEQLQKLALRRCFDFLDFDSVGPH
jgi:hypothetical protein